MSWQQYEIKKAWVVKLNLSSKDYQKAILKIIRDLEL